MVKRNTNKIFIIVTIFIVIMLVATPAFVNVYNKHRILLYNSVIDNCKYQALKCYREDNCGTVITLQELYDLKYMETLVNPLTKEIYDSNTTLTIDEGRVNFNG